ncbi:hypothetical protein HY489_05280 [Candidatus Woesearchaeota archaeon]|nr:hypothetical protein [Candidatus Woesearchaeota archaeon]
MRSKVFLLVCILLVVLVACTKAECKKTEDCVGKPKSTFTASCEEKKCVYKPIPGVVGNGVCDSGENKCSHPQDCGQCSGKVPQSQFLSYKCTEQKLCVEEVSGAKPVFAAAEASMSGDKFKVDFSYNMPFNMKKDLFTVTFTLSQSPQNRDERLVRAELIGTTKDKRTITVLREDINRYLWTSGSSVTHDFILDFPTVELEGELSNLVLSIDFEYVLLQGSKRVPKQGSFKVNVKDKLVFVKPGASYSCPSSCDDKNLGTRDTCSAQTGFFCRHEPIPNACGNYQCDQTETKCSCAQDCGPCQGSAGNFLDFTCRGNQCVTILKPGTSVQPNSLFDDRNFGPVQLNNNFKFNNPFTVGKDELQIDLKIYKSDPSVSRVVVETVRVLDGQQQLADASPNQELSSSASTVSVSIPGIVEYEEDHNLIVGVWYMYVQNDQEKRGNFQKPLGKVTLIRPE